MERKENINLLLVGRIFKTLCIIFILTYIESINAQLTFSALKQKSWDIYFQINDKETPHRVSNTYIAGGSTSAIDYDGKAIAIEIPSKGIAICPVSTTVKCQVLSSKQQVAVRPTWHPKTNQLLFVNYNTNAKTEDADIFITPDSKLLTSASPLILQTGIQDYPDVSSDGQWLAYTSSQTISLRQGGVQVVQQLWLMDLITGKAHQLFTGSHQDIHPDWSPSSKEIAFSTNSSGQFEIWLIDKKGNNLRQLTSGAGSKTWPAWSPDGKSIMFTMMKLGRYSLWIVDIDGSNLRAFQPFGSDKKIQMRDADWQ